MMSFTLRISPAITTLLYNKIPPPFAATSNNAFLRRSYANQTIHSEFPPVPVQDRPFNETVMESIWRHSLEQPTRPAFLNAENLTDKLTFAELFLRIHSAASFLDGIGFSHGDVAAVVLPNCWQYSVAFTSVLMRGGCISGINPVSTEYELHRAFTLTNCKVVFLSDVLLDRIWEVAQKCPHIQKLIVVPSKFPPPELPANLPDKIVSFSSLVNHYPNMRRAPPIDVKKDLAFLPFSSGTTGPPKAVMLSHQNIGTMATIFNRHFDTYIAKKMDPAWDWKREHFFLVLPFFHIYGFILSVNILLSGASGIVLSRFDLDLFCKTIQDFKIKFVMLVPPILVALAKSRVAQRYDLSSLRFIMTGAAPVGSDLCEEVKKAIPSLEQIAQGYGMTEESMASHLPVFGQHNMAAAGRLASNLEMKIADMGNHRSVPLGTRGEICCRGPTIMLGYLNNPEATAEAIDEEGWLRTGDIGYHDGKGWTYVVDRLKDLIKVKGFQVSPAELEDILLSHKGVKDCGVVGVPDRLSGEVPKAFIVKADEALTEQEVKEFVRTRVAKFKQLAEVEFVEEIPKSPSGKILKRLLPKP